MITAFRENFPVVLLVCSSGLFIVGALSYSLSPKILTEDEILAFAEENVPAIDTPPKPVGRTIKETKTRKSCNKVLTMRGLKIHNKTVCHEIPTVVERFVDPTDAEMNEWEEEINQLNRDRSRQVKSEISSLTFEENFAIRAFVKDMIQILSGLFGMVFGAFGVYLGLRKDRRAHRNDLNENST